MMNVKSIRIHLTFLMLVTAAALSADTILQDTALYLAGKKPALLSSLHKLASSSREYSVYSSEMARYQKFYSTNTMRHIEEWRVKNLSSDAIALTTCFYPFAGPDLVNAVMFYPDARTYVLIGLETGGCVPDLKSMNSATLKKGRDMMVRGLQTLVRLNFYRTLSMADDLEKSPFNGTIPHILVHAVWLGLTPVRAWSVEAATNGQLLLHPLKPGVIFGNVAIDFKDRNGKEKRVIYLKLNLEDWSLASRTSWKKYLEGLASCAGILKASSYLPPRPGFNTITRLCLKIMDVIVQDDSGIPLRSFGKEWDVKFFGSYHGPHRLFPSYGQPDLLQAYDNLQPQPLKFHYSYDRSDNSRNMMVCRRLPPGPLPEGRGK
jgi:hypothetical protein